MPAHLQSTMPVILPTSSIFGSATDRLGTDDCLATCAGWDTCTKEPISSPIPKITVATRYATGQPEEKKPKVPWRVVERKGKGEFEQFPFP